MIRRFPHPTERAPSGHQAARLGECRRRVSHRQAPNPHLVGGSMAFGRTRACALRVLVWLVVACGESQVHSGTNTNWLRRCENDSDCGSGIHCLCGRCSLECDSDAGCDAGASCATAESNRLQCGGDAPRICQATCSTDADCEDDGLCHFGTCSDPLPVADCGSALDALVCEDFEGVLRDSAIIATEGNSVRTVAIRTPSGSRALEAEITAAPSVAYWRADIPPQSSGNLGLRGWLHVPEDDTGYDFAPLGLWSDAETEWALRLVVKDAALELWSYTTPLTGSVPLVRGAWHCVQASITVAEAPNGSVMVSIDGEPALETTGVDTLPTGGIEALTVGNLWAGTPGTLQLDRVQLGPTLASCWQ